MHDLYKDAEDRYQGMRDAAFAFTWAAWSPKVNSQSVDLRLTPINAKAIQQSEENWPRFSTDDRPETFKWSQLFNQVRTTPRRFDMAIWDGSKLCALAIGKASRGDPKLGPDSNVTMRYLQGAPKSINSFRGHIGLMTLEAVTVYARLLERKKIYIRSPLAAVIPMYKKAGFRFEKRRHSGIYMSKKV